MSKIDKSLQIIDRMTVGGSAGILKIDARSALLVTVVYLCFMLGVPTMHVDILLWYALFPIITAPLFGLTYSSVFLQSLIILPIVVLIAAFNPIIDRQLVASSYGINITRGWLLFFGVVIRGLLSMQALLILIRSYGFIGIVGAMRRLGVPKILTTQLLMVFRYIKVLIEEGQTMFKAKEARGYGKAHLSLKLWGVMMGQLFLRSVARAERLHKAMLARGFNGDIPFVSFGKDLWNDASTVFLVVWCLLFLFLRLFNLSLLFA